MTEPANPDTSDAMKKTTSPYDLQSSDNPGSIITQIQLRGENYDEWAKALRTSLRARRKWGFVDGSIPQQKEGTPKLEGWWTVQSMIISWILNTIEPTLSSTISYSEDAKSLWDDLQERLSVANRPRIQQLKTELAECKQGGMPLVTYYGTLKSLWEELANYQQIPCCMCDVASRITKQKEEERVHQLLMGLDENMFNTVRSNLLAMALFIMSGS